MFDRFRKRLFEALEFPVAGNWVSRAADLFIMSLIFLNVVAIILETVPDLRKEYRAVFGVFEIVSVVAFSTEYLLRLWSCTTDPRYAHPVWGRVRYVFSFMALVDLVSVLPFYVGLWGVINRRLDLRFLRALRLARLVRVLKLTRYVKSLSLIGQVIRAKRGELVMTLVFSALMLVVSSALMYYVENPAQPDKFTSIPATMWWAVETLTTLGYGDIVPATPWGRLLGSLVALAGVGMFALPTAILGSGFVDAVREQKAVTVCPHCGKPLNSTDNSKLTTNK